MRTADSIDTLVDGSRPCIEDQAIQFSVGIRLVSKARKIWLSPLFSRRRRTFQNSKILGV